MLYELKKGDKNLLDGRLLVYARISDAAVEQNKRYPAISMVHNNFLAVEGDYRYSQSLKDFFKEELGLSLEEGFEELLAQFNLGELPGSTDPEILRKRLEGFKSMQEFIPKPAKIVTVNNESEIIEREGDIFYLGEFRNFANANLAVNAFPVFYQAIYKEQLIRDIDREIETLMGQTSVHHSSVDNYSEFKGDLGRELLANYIPVLFYSAGLQKRDQENEERLRNFLNGYPYPQEVQKMLDIISDTSLVVAKKERLVELFIKKIVALTKEDFKTLKDVQKQLDLEFG